MIGLSGSGFGNWLICAVLLTFVVSLVILFVASKRGIDVESYRFQIPVLSTLLLILIFIPFWLTDITINVKLIVTIIMIIVAVGNYTVVSRIQKTLSNYSKKQQHDEVNY